MISPQVTNLAVALQRFDPAVPRLQSWGSAAARVLTAGGRLLACASHAGSREQAYHLAAELGDPSEDDLPGLAAVPVLPAAGTEAGGCHGTGLAEQVRSLGRSGDILVCLSAEEPVSDMLAAAGEARASGLTTLALTGSAPNALAEASADAISVHSPDSRIVEEVHLVAIHIFCTAVDSCLRDRIRAGGESRGRGSQALAPSARPDAHWSR